MIRLYASAWRHQPCRALLNRSALIQRSGWVTTQTAKFSSDRTVRSIKTAELEEDVEPIVQSDVPAPIINTKPESQTQEQSTPAQVLPKWTDYSDRLDPVILNSMRTIFKYERASKVQAAILDLMPVQQDLLVRSKTGTGKTLAFLVPALQRALERFEALGLSNSQLKTYASRNASTLVISPTRELANQIASEARRLMTAPGPGMKALCVVGGDSKRDQLGLMRRQRNDFVVATPGRLLDLLENTKDFSDMIKNVHTLVLDEADTLLEMGFRSELEKILTFLPETRQTYMFSATVSRDIQRIARDYLQKDHKFMNTVSKDEQDSHQLIKQEYIVRPLHEHIKIVLSLIISKQLENPNVKIIVFLQTTKMTMLYASVFKTLRRLYPNQAFQQFDIHAQRSQDSRTKVSQAFRTANAGSVLFTTDVSARGVDYPDVAQVIQVGSANTRDLYIHRLGRTGRAGKAGQGVLILQPTEIEFLHTLGRDIPITEKYFPDSEIELGASQRQVFNLAYRVADAELVRDTYSSLSGALLPRARDLRANKKDMVEALDTWFGEFGEGNIPRPQVSSRLLGGSGSGRDSGARGSFGGDRRNGYAGQEYDRPRRNMSDRGYSGSRQSEWRPKRLSEYTSFGDGFTRKRKDFSVGRSNAHADRRRG